MRQTIMLLFKLIIVILVVSGNALKIPDNGVEFEQMLLQMDPDSRRELILLLIRGFRLFQPSYGRSQRNHAAEMDKANSAE